MRALITGATDGIGRASAVALARAGYTIDLLGINEARGASALAELRTIEPERAHRLHLVDLSVVERCQAFLDGYSDSTEALDLLVLNANTYADRHVFTEDGIDRNFQVGAVSRYMFAVGLDPLLQRAEDGRVLHVAGMHRQVVRTASRIRYDQLRAPRYGVMRSVWQSFAASALMTRFLAGWLDSPVAHSVFDPGVVATRTLTDRNAMVRALTRIFSDVWEPERVGEALAALVTSTRGADGAGRTFKRGRLQPKFEAMDGLEADFDTFRRFCVDRTGVGEARLSAV